MPAFLAPWLQARADQGSRHPGGADNCVISPAEMLRGMELAGQRQLGARSGQAEGVAGSLGSGSWRDGIFLLPYTYGGSYDRDIAGAPNVDPRQWVAQSFFSSNNPDQYDFLLVLTNFDWNAGALTRGLYWSIANDVTGIGIDPLDLSTLFGSERLQGYIDGMRLADYRLADGSLDRQRVREILNHELGHRWLVHPSFDDGSGVSNALLGRDQAHWSYLLDSDASFLYGSDWTSNGDGTYTATAVRKRFSDLDLYLMGMNPAANVAPMTLLENPAIDITQIPQLGATVTATPRTITIDDVIAAEGARSPDFNASQKEFRVAVVYLYDPALGLYTADIELAGELKAFWRQSFFKETRGRGVVEVAPRTPPASGGAVDLNRALAWLAARTEGDLWSDSAITVARDSAEAIEALGRAGGYTGKVDDALEVLPDATAESGELRLRRLEALARWGNDPAVVQTFLQEALAAQEAAGGFASLPRYNPDHATSARGVRALAVAGRTAEANAAWNWLRGRQNADGGWPWQEGGSSSVAATLEVVLAARVLDPQGFFARPEVASAYNFLLGKRIAGGMGDGGDPNVAQTALFLQFVLDQAIDQTLVQDAIDFLSSSQQADGSWEGSVYKTALATAALQTFLLPDPFIDAGEALVDPADPFDDEGAEMLAAVRNGGTFLAAGTEYSWQVLPQGAGPQAEPLLSFSGTLPELADTGFVTVSQELLPGQLPAGDYEIRFVIDPYRRISEKTRDNNRVVFPLEVRSHPAGIDLEVRREDLQASPDEITAMPQPLTFAGVVRNLGLTPAVGVRVAAFDGDPRQGIVLGETTVDVPALGSALFSIALEVDGPRPHEIFAVADPDRLTGDADTLNNKASKLLLLRLRTDLEVVPGSFVADPPTGEVGVARTLSLLVHNGGTTTLENFPVAFRYDGGSGSFLIRQVVVPGPLAPGEEVGLEVVFTPNLDGLLELTATIDPQNTLGDAEPADNSAQISLAVGANSLTNLRLELAGIETLPSPPLQGQNAEVRVAIYNPTRNPAPAFLARLWLDAIGTGTLLAENTFPGLAGESSALLTATWNVDAPQNRKIYAEVDPDDEIDELDEEDNESFILADVLTLPDLALSSGSVTLTPDFPQVGDALHFDVEVLNQGDQPSLATQLKLVGEGGALLATASVPALAGHERQSFALDWTPPGGPGDYDLVLRVNDPSGFVELEFANNAASFPVALQDGNLYVSNQIFSPNGDGIKDTASFFFRLPATQVEILDRDGETIRTFDTGGVQSQVWDGRSDKNLLVRDGVYKVRLVGTPENVETWVAVDNNLTSMSYELGQRLLVGFLEPQLPGGSPDYSRFISLIVNPVIEEIYAVEHLVANGGAVQTYTLRRFDGEEMVEIGEYPSAGRQLISVDATGTLFLAGDFWDSSFDLIRYPGPTVETVSSPGEGGYRPWLSPDGRYIGWIEQWNASEILIEDLESGDSWRFSASDEGYWGGCGYTVNWTRNNQLVVSLGRWGDEGFYYNIDTTTNPPSGEILLAQDSFGVCGGGEVGLAGIVGAPTAPAGSLHSAPGRTNVGWYNNNLGGSVDLEKGTLTWVMAGGGGSDLQAPATAEGSTGEDFWHAASFGFYGDGGISIGRWRLADGGALAEVPVDLGEVIFWSAPPLALSNDGDVVTLQVSSGGTLTAGLSAGEAQTASGFLPAAPPETFELARRDDLKTLHARAGVILQNQRLIDWRRGDQRGLPFELGDAYFTAADKYLVADLDQAWQTGDLVPYFTPAANLTTRLRPRILFGDAGVDLWVLATDAYLDYYRIDYADLDDPSLTYHAIGLPSDEPLFGERWGTWLPPGNGRYRLKLEAVDRAGNRRVTTKRVIWNGDNDIANLYLDHRYVSPRSSPGIKDVLTFHYTVLRPANLRFAIENEDGTEVATIEVAADTIGQRSTSFGGDDGVGNPLPDGNYLLTYGEASWPFVIDNTPPEAVLTIGPTRLLADLPQEGQPVETDLLANEIFAAVRDVNIVEWTYETRTATFPDWLVVDQGISEFERDTDRAWRTVGASTLVRRDLRLVARDLAGNETITARSHRDEKIRLAESEPICRSTLPPCVYPERPAVAELGDNGGRLEMPAHVLDPAYDTVLVQSTVWTDNLVLRLEHRPISLTGLPTGPWQSGDIEVKSSPVPRAICTTETSAKAPDARCHPVGDGGLRVLYWNHASLPLVPREVRLVATNADGQDIFSPEIEYQPAVPLYLEHLGVFADGDRLKITNTSNAPILGIDLMQRVETASGTTWTRLFDLSPRLRPGEFAVVTTGCALLTLGGEQVRAQGTGALGEDANSLPVVVPDREGYSSLGADFVPARCSAGSEANVLTTSTAARGLASDVVVKPCALSQPKFPTFLTGRGDSPAGLGGRVPRDPAGVPFTRYELLVNGAPFLTLDGPFDSRTWNQTIDFSSLGEGSYTLSERYSYAVGQPGLLGTCPQDLPLTIDRTPPNLQIADPQDGDYVCPSDLVLPVALEGSDATRVTEEVRIDGSWRTGSDSCSPYATIGGRYEIEANTIAPGLRWLSASAVDLAGNASCVPIRLTVPELPLVVLSAQPILFSPTNLLGRPTETEATFTTRSPGYWEAEVRSLGGALVQILPPTATDGITEASILWGGRDVASAVLPDGFYHIVVKATSPCGATHSQRVRVELDSTPPEAVLSAPSAGAVLGSVVEWKGLARDLHFEKYELQILGITDGPTEWTTVYTQSARQTETVDAPLGTWRTDSFPSGDYLVRMLVTDRPGNQALSAEIPVRIRDRNFIKRFEREPEMFSPNADGIFDNLEIRYELFQEAKITLEVRDADDVAVVRLVDQVSQPGDTEITVLWDGHVDLGGRAADGAYELVLLAEDPQVPQTLESEEEKLSATVDTVPPALEITSPLELALSGLPLPIVGSLGELHPDRYLLEVESAAVPRFEVATGPGAFASRQLYELAGQPDGEYFAYYSAADVAGNSASLLRRFRIDNTAPAVVIQAPTTGEIRDTTEDYVVLLGEITEENLIEWAFSYALGEAPEPADFIDIVRRVAVAPAVLPDGAVDFDWDASQLADGPYTLRLEARDAIDRVVATRIVLIVDNTPPVVSILEPADGAILAEPLDVFGAVTDANLRSWQLHLRRSGESTTSLLGTGAFEVLDDLLAPWSVLPIDGDYELTLQADDRAGHASEVTVTVGVTTEPLQPPVLLSATVQDQRNVALVWQPGPGPTPAGYHLYRSGTRITVDPVEELSYLDLSLADGVYTYTVRAVAGSGVETVDSNSLEAVVSNGLPIARISAPADGDRISDLYQVKGTAWRDGGFQDWQLWVRPELGSWQLLGGGSAPVLADDLASWDTALPQFPDGVYQLRLDARDIYAHNASHTVTVTVDNTEPVAPVLTFAASSAQDPDAEVNDIGIEWTLDPSPVDLDGFYLYRNGQLANAPGPVVGSPRPFLIDALDYDDRNLPDGTYVYYVTAADEAGNESAASNLSPPIVIDTGRPHAVIIDPADGSEFEESVVLTAETPDLDVVSLRFEYRAVGSPDWITLTTLGSPPWRTPFAPGAAGPYEVRPVAADGVGEDPAPESIVITETDLPPDSPAALTLRVDGGTIHLSWQAAADPFGDLAGYHVYRDGTRITATALPKTQLTYNDENLADAYYNYEVRAIDEGGNEGQSSPVRQGEVVTPRWYWSSPVVATATTGLDAAVPTYNDEIELYRKNTAGELVLVDSHTDGVTYFPGQALAPGFNSFVIRGRSSAGNKTRFSRELVLLRHDPPAMPENFVASVTGSDVELDWTPVVDPDLLGYDLDRAGTALGFSTSPLVYEAGTHELTANFGSLADWQRMVDGNSGTFWAPPMFDAYYEPLVIEWRFGAPQYLGRLNLDTPGPAYHLELEVQMAGGEWLWFLDTYSYYNYFSYELGIEAQAIRLRIPRYNCYNCRFAEIGLELESRTAIPPQTDAGIADGAWTYHLAARNRYGQSSVETSALALVGVTLPESPLALMAEKGECGEIVVSWQPPAVLPAIHRGYRLYRSAAGGSWQAIADLSPSTLEFLDSGLADATQYTYRVTTLAEISGLILESAPSNEEGAQTACLDPDGPVLLQPTVAGSPIAWPSSRADIGGRGWPGSAITLLLDGEAVAELELDAVGVERSFQLPDYAYDLRVENAAGRYVVYVADNGGGRQLVRYELETGSKTTVPAINPYDPVLSADGERLVYVEDAAQADLYLYDFTSGQSTRLTDDGAYERRPHFLPNGRGLVYLSSDNTDRLNRLDLTTGVVTSVISSSSPDLEDFALSSDGTLAVVRTWNGPWVVDLATGEVTEPYSWTTPGFSATPFSPNGTKLVFSMPDWSPEWAYLYLADLTTGLAEPISQRSGEFGATFLDEGTVVLWQTQPGGSLRLLARSLMDDSERILLDGVAIGSVDFSDRTSLTREGESALWVLQDAELLRLQQPSGQFVVPNVALHAGTNTFTAVQSFAGETQVSEAIELNVDPALFGDAEALVVEAAPSFPLTGQIVVVQGTYRNNGPADLFGLEASLVRVSPAGASEVVAFERVDLPAGEVRRLRYTFDTSGQTGDFLFRLVLDPADLLGESDELNNRVTELVPVRETLGLEAGLATNKTVYQAGESVVLQSSLASNTVPRDTEVRLFIETPTGDEVAEVSLRELEGFGGETEEFADRWNSAGVVPGVYRAVLLARQNGVEVARATADFSIEPRLAVTLTATADRTFYVRGEAANFLAKVRNTGDATIQNAVLHLIVEPMPSGASVATQERRISALSVGDLRSFNWSWLTDAVPGAYDLRAVLVSQAGTVLAEAAPYAFVIGPVGAALTGDLSVLAAATEPGGNVTIDARVANAGDAALLGGRVRVEIVDPKTGAVVQTFESPADFPIAVPVARSWPYAPAMRQLQSFVAILSAVDSSGAAQQLDTATLDIVDLTPPTLEWLGRDSFACSATLPLRVRALDTFSQVVAVDYRVDAGPLALPLILETVEDTVWISYLFADPARVTPYRLTFGARDAAGNPATPLVVDFLPTIDEEAPVLTVTAPAPDVCVAGPVSATFSATDANLVRLEAWLDGVLYTSGTPIADGAHELRVQAEDGCGRITEESHVFTVDSAAPTLTITAPETLCSPPPSAVTFSAADGNLASVTATLNKQTYLSGTPILAEGGYFFDLEARDTCGNLSHETRRFRLDNSLPVLTLTAPAEGSCVAGPVAATWTANDPNLASTYTLLDGLPYLAGLPIADGTHQLFVHTEDYCGGVAELTRSFTVDSLAPVITFAGATDGGTYEPPLLISFTATDANLVATTALLDGIAVGSPVEVSAPGPHTLVVTASDCAGNRREEVLHFTILGGGGTLVLTGQLELPARVLHTEPLPVMAELLNGSQGPLVGTTFRVRLVDPAGGAVLAEEVLQLDLAAGGGALLDYDFATSDLSPGNYRVELRAAGTYENVPFDLELDRADVEILGLAVDVPLNDPGMLVLLTLLLATAGFLHLRRRVSHASKGHRMNPDRSRTDEFSARRGHRRGFWLLPLAMLLLPPAAVRAESSCDERFPQLRRLLLVEKERSASPAAEDSVVLPRAAGAALLTELEIEKALWQDEAQRRSAELAAFGLAEAAARLDERGRELEAHFAAVERSLRQGEALPATAVAKILRCSEEQSRSAEIAARGFELAHREARMNEAPPTGYLDPPSAGLRRRLISSRLELANQQGMGEVASRALADDELVAKAAELGNDPVRIYRYVVEKIRPAYYFGAIRGPEATLRAGEGNDADQAALLAGLLRAADFPARVVWGTVEIELADLLAHWNANSGQELERLMTAAGVPWSPVAQAGRVVAYRVERAWCEVYLPYANFRGVVLDDSGQTWLGLDPQIKPRLGRATESVLDQLGLDGETFVDAYLDGDSCEAPLERAAACQLPSAVIAQQVDQSLGAGSWLGRTAAPELPPQVEATLPAGRIGVVRSVLGWDIDFPDAFRHRVRLRARAGNRTLMDTTVAASDLAGREAALWFVPASPEDAALAAAYGDLWLTPPYLVDVKLQLWVDGEELALGNGRIGMGEAFELEVTLTSPDGDSRTFKNSELAGVPVGFALAPGRHGYQPFGGQAGNTTEVLALLAAGWLDATADFADRLARLEGLPVVHPFPTFATVGSVVVPLGSAGLIERLDWRGVYIDADLFGMRAVGSPEAAARWLRLAGLEASAQERALFERYGMASVSADLLIALARSRGVPVHEITLANLAAVLPSLPYSVAIKTEIEGWVRSGGRALVPATALDFIEFSGVGYILQDEETGEARYQLAGGLSGGMIAVPPFEVVPGVATPLQVPLNGFVNTNGSEAVAITMHDGNLQINTVAKTLGSEAGTLPLRVIVRDRQGRLVSNANVVFTVLAGGGKLNGGDSATVSSAGGVASVNLKLGEKTDKNPYYLLFPNETWAQRADLTIVKAEVNGYGMNDLFYEFGRPDEVTQLLTPLGSSLQGWPHLSVGTPVLALPADRFQNPVANQEVTFTLSASPPEPGKGPELLSIEARANCGGTTSVMAGECGGTGSVTDKGSITGVWSYLIVGEDDSYSVTATASGGSGNVTTTITATVIKSIPTGVSVGWPTVLVAGRAQPVGPNGSGSAEAYAPGKPSLPLKVSLFVVHEEFTVVGCGSNRFCTQPAGKYKTRRLATSPITSCFPAGCGGGQITESATIQFNGNGGISGSQSNPVSAGVYEQAVTLPGSPGRYAVRATPSARVSVPKQPSNPAFPNEIVPCTAEGCGAVLELRSLSSPGWFVEFVLWAVRGRPEGTPPVVKLGHENRHESETNFPYTIEPSDYPALGVGMAFLEDGTVPLLARAEGRGPGQATLPVGKIFQKPDGKHELMVLVNPGWVWKPGPGEPVSMMIEGEKIPFSVVQFDVDVDSDNTNGKDAPDRNDGEENIEEDGGPDGFGKFIFVNHDNDNAETDDNRPDYVELTAITKEDNMVPVEIELRPEQGNYGGVQITFDYDGPAAGSLPDGTGESLGQKGSYTYFNYEGKKLATYRLWKIDSQDGARSSSDYLAPNTPYSAGDLGLSSSNPRKTFWLEAINGKVKTAELVAKDVTVKLAFNSQNVEEKVRLTPVAANIGFNNGNNFPAYMRPGVPDGPIWTIDEHDERVEDQGNGFAWWVSDIQPVNKENIEDLVPFVVDVPQKLIADGWEFGFQLVDPSRSVDLETYKIDRSYVQFTEHVRAQHLAEPLLSSGLGYHNMESVDYIDREFELAGEQAAYLMRVSPVGWNGSDDSPKTVRLNLLARDKQSTEWVSIDSVKLELKPIKRFFSWWTGRHGFESYPTTFRTECHPTTACESSPLTLKAQNTFAHGPLIHIENSALPEPEVKPYFIFVHGYNVKYPDDALGAASKVYRRIFWQGYRGNMLAVTWQGDESAPLFSPNVDNAFRTAPNLRNWIEGVLQRPPYNAEPANTTLMAHSLGNHVAFEAMRLHAIERKLSPGTGPLFSHMIAVEPAVWGETFWTQGPKSYSLPSVPTTYTEDDLRWNSWAFWFHQRHHRAVDAVSTLVHSWAPADYALTAMKIDECLVRNPGLHFIRGSGGPDLWRVPVEDSWGALNDLTSSKAVMMQIRVPPPIGCVNFLVPPAGQAPNENATVNIDAGTLGWGAFSHSAFQTYPAYEIYNWYYEILRGRVPKGQDKF